MFQMTRLFHIVLACIAVGLLVSACDEQDSFSTSKSDWLTFSSDTVKFDTVVTTVGSSTRTFHVFNRAKKGLRIKDIRLAGGAASAFRVNVDGTYLGPSMGYAMSDLELHGGDSLVAFVEVTLKENGSDEPKFVSDKLMFTLESGLQQTVTLTAYGQDVYMLRGETFRADTTLAPGRPYVIYDSLRVAAGTTLTLQPGVQLYFHEKASLLMHGTLVAQGTLDKPIVFRCDRTDRMFSNLPYDNVAGLWGGLHFYGESMGNKLNYCDIHGGSYGIVCDAPASLDADKLTLENSVVHNVKGVGLQLISCRALVANTQISNALGDCLSLLGGSVQFVHCTLAQLYPWNGTHGNALSFANVKNDTVYPLQRALFQNCLVTGSADDEVMGTRAKDTGVAFNYHFANCFLNTTNADKDTSFVNIRYDLKDNKDYKWTNFKNSGTDYLYDFRLDSLSTAIDAGDAALSTAYPYDRLGVSRLSDTAPDAGCYEFVRKKK
jgi:hypothetical protein